MNAVLVAIGDELLSGVRREGNCAWLAWLLHDAGWDLLRMEVVPDDLSCIVDMLKRWVGKTDLLVLSGGLGPTHDDKTRYALAEYLGGGLSVDDSLYDRVVGRYKETLRAQLIERSRPVQGLIPLDSRGVYNPAGSALGIHFEKEGTKIWSFPGVPFEFKEMAEQELRPLLNSVSQASASQVGEKAARAWRSVSVIGIPESAAVERIPEIIADQRLHISVLPSYRLVEFVIRGELSLVEASVRTLRERFAGDVLPEGCATLPEAVLATGREKNLTLSCAESCTGGLIGAALTQVAGSSAVFAGSAVVYENEAKINLLKVEPALLKRYGAVSGECAEAMAKGALEVYGTSWAVAVTGIAGPDGGTVKKPVGTVWFAVASENQQTISFTRRLLGNRELVRERAVRVALASVWRKMAAE